MKGYRVYNSIQQLKDMGFKRAAVAAQLQINRRTVDRYWTMTADEYETQQQALKRGSSVDDYRDQILYWLRAYAIWGANFFETFCDTFILPKTIDSQEKVA